MKNRINVKYYKQKIMALTMSGLMLISNTGCFKIKDKEKDNSKNDIAIEAIQEINNINKEDIFVVNDNVEINFERIPENIHDQIINFENKLKEYDSEFDINNYRKLINETNFVDISAGSDNFSFDLWQSYDKEKKTIYYDLDFRDGVIYKELFNRINEKFTTSDYGKFFNSAFNNFFTEQILDYNKNEIDSQIIKSLSYIFGTKNLYDIYMKGNIYDLEYAFSKLISEESAQQIINDFDAFHNVIYNFDIEQNSNEVFQSNQNYLIHMYFLSNNNKQIDVKNAKEFASTLIYNIDLFAYYLFDPYAKERFDERLKETINDDRLYKLYESYSLNKEELENKNYLNMEGNIKNIHEIGGINLNDR